MEGIANFFREVVAAPATRQQAQFAQQQQMQTDAFRSNRAEKALVEARIARDEEQQRGQMFQALVNAGQTPEVAEMAATALRGGFGNFNQVGQGAGQFQRLLGLQSAFDAQGRGDLPAMNQNLALYRGQPLETSRVQGDMVVNPFGTPGGVVQATPLGQARIATERNRAVTELERGRAASERTREIGARADIVQDDRDSLNAPLQRPATAAGAEYMRQEVASPAQREGQVPSVEPSGAAATIDADVQRAVRELGHSGAASQLGIPRIDTQEAFDRLPAGAYYVDPDDGQIYRK